MIDNINISVGDVVEWLDRRGVNVEFRYNKIVEFDNTLKEVTLDIGITVHYSQIINVYYRKDNC